MGPSGANLELELLKGLANAGPTALIAAILLWQLVKERDADRQLLNQTLKGIENSITALREVIAMQSATLDKLGDSIDRSNARFEQALPQMTCQNWMPKMPRREDDRGELR